MTVLGKRIRMHGFPVMIAERDDGTISLRLSSDRITAYKYVWTFKLAYTRTGWSGEY